MGKFSTLERAKLTKSWSLKERAALASFLEKQNLKKGEHLFYEQTQEKKLYFIDSGSLKIQCGNMFVELEQGASLGELSIVSSTQKQTSAIAAEDCVFWVITESQWEKIKSQQPALAFKLSESIQRKLAELLNSSVPPPKISGLNSPGAAESKPSANLI